MGGALSIEECEMNMRDTAIPRAHRTSHSKSRSAVGRPPKLRRERLLRLVGGSLTRP
jgi:hypothetical protein